MSETKNKSEKPDNTAASTPIERIPDFRLADYIYRLKNPKLVSLHKESQDLLLEGIKDQKLAPLYFHLHAEGLPSIPWDEQLYQQLKADNEKEIESIKDKIKEAEAEEEELSIIEGWVKLGNYYAKIGDREEAIKTLRRAYDLTASSGVKIDICFTIIRIGFFFDDKPFIGAELDAVKLLIDRGGDWERRNRYKTYNGLYLLSSRQFDEATDLLIDSLSTFTSTEISTYEEIVEYAVLCGVISLGRVDLKRKVIDSPEVLSLLPTTPALEPITMLTNSLYTGEYSTYFQALARVEEEFLRVSRYLSPHSAYYLREMRRKAYAQLLESYKTLSMKSMADAFGVSVEFLDQDLSKFVPQKKLNCVLDRVNGVIVTNRPDNKNAQYQQVVKQGDVLLTKLQKYGAAVRLSGAERVA
ncbi:proteasome regulatory particle lid subunit RPN7 [Sugiyamaella lignohabitans]|uniref:Proteasome regulatory particle lid subunit RPN7 n=1 Tax=Sugiyamaella lignohabitans TaxID=796027 RepID=A0A161HGQ5_9ASCO|nr:proteasome regulatory particle lid subunit RPN7 [Sugiyamaella lignohabitans]ANB14970.1 proteasome regulatory particle lid subunit RPN7 [Sugiyamaella lignohabitans]